MGKRFVSLNKHQILQMSQRPLLSQYKNMTRQGKFWTVTLQRKTGLRDYGGIHSGFEHISSVFVTKVSFQTLLGPSWQQMKWSDVLGSFKNKNVKRKEDGCWRQPVLPATSSCSIVRLDYWDKGSCGFQQASCKKGPASTHPAPALTIWLCLIDSHIPS